MFQLRSGGPHCKVPVLQNRPSGKRIGSPHYCMGREPGCGDARLVFVPLNVCGMTVRTMVDAGCSTSVLARALVTSAKLVRLEEVRMMEESTQSAAASGLNAVF